MRVIFTVFLTFFGSLSTAEPSSEVQTLMDQKLTIFDWGMFELKQDLRRADIDASVGYNWDENQVTIAIWNFNFSGNPNTMEQTKSDCEGFFAKIDQVLWINDGTDRTEDYCVFCSYFSHNGWTTQSLKEARQKIKNRLYYSYSDGSNKCTRKAYGTSIAVSSFN